MLENVIFDYILILDSVYLTFIYEKYFFAKLIFVIIKSVFLPFKKYFYENEEVFGLASSFLYDGLFIF